MAFRFVREAFRTSLSNCMVVSTFVRKMRSAGIDEKFGKFLRGCNLVEVTNVVVLVKPILEDIKSCFDTVELEENVGIIQPQGIHVVYKVDGDLGSIDSSENYSLDIKEKSIIQIYAWPGDYIYMLDLKLPTQQLNEVISVLLGILKSTSPKYVYNCCQLFEYLEELLDVSYKEFNNCFDVQHGNEEMSARIKNLNLEHYLKDTLDPMVTRNKSIWLHRPMHRDLITYAALDAYCIHQISQNIQAIDLSRVLEETVAKYESYKHGTFLAPINLEIVCDMDFVERSIGTELLGEIKQSDTDLFLDIGKKLKLNSHSSTRAISDVDISEELVNTILDGVLDKDSNKLGNRFILGSTLHRLSRVMYEDKTVGLTWRLGRKINGLEPIFQNKVDGSMNILLCGPPNVGKTSLLRALCENLSRNRSLCLVDTSGEVCGGGVLGDSRVFKPCSPEEQYKLLIDIVKNHSPSHIVIDEVHTKEEMRLCSTIAKRGVKVIASVHGIFEDLIYNQELNACFGGIHKIILSDKRADLLTCGRKTRIERLEKSLFDVVIQLNYTFDRFEYCFITDVNEATDRVLDSLPVHITCRYLAGDGLYEKVSSIEPKQGNACSATP